MEPGADFTFNKTKFEKKAYFYVEILLKLTITKLRHQTLIIVDIY